MFIFTWTNSKIVCASWASIKGCSSSTILKRCHRCVNTAGAVDGQQRPLINGQKCTAKNNLSRHVFNNMANIYTGHCVKFDWVRQIWGDVLTVYVEQVHHALSRDGQADRSHIPVAGDDATSVVVSWCEWPEIEAGRCQLVHLAACCALRRISAHGASQSSCSMGSRAPFGGSGGLKQCLRLDKKSCYWQATGLEDNGVGCEFETLANLV